ncbi:unnamed protein product [Periconia digitata]|uniref:Uncharacterized protein n=1 Tax=Periconia digitata TaxID=1303443 RepID=A0A9W4U2Y2_9PLEO|nr:unnamed protein product [Periconia digitata]
MRKTSKSKRQQSVLSPHSIIAYFLHLVPFKNQPLMSCDSYVEGLCSYTSSLGLFSPEDHIRLLPSRLTDREILSPLTPNPADSAIFSSCRDCPDLLIKSHAITTHIAVKTSVPTSVPTDKH